MVALDDSSSMAVNKSRVPGLQVEQLQVQNTNTSFLFSSRLPPYLLRSHSFEAGQLCVIRYPDDKGPKLFHIYQNNQKINNFLFSSRFGAKAEIVHGTD